MTDSAFEARELSREECLSLLATEPYGRLVFVQGTMPMVIPVNYVLEGSGIVLRTREGSITAESVRSSTVAFQADHIDRENRSGWSVTVVGRARIAQEPVEVARLSELPLHTWVAGERHAFLVVELGIVSGRRIGGPERPHGQHAAASPSS